MPLTSGDRACGPGLRAKGPFFPPSPVTPETLAVCGLAFGTPSMGGREVREDTRLPKPQSPRGQRSVPRPWPKHMPTSRATLEMCLKKEGQEDGRREGEGKGENCALSRFHLHLLFPLLGTFFTLTSLLPALSAFSCLLKCHRLRDVFPGHPS